MFVQRVDKGQVYICEICKCESVADQTHTEAMQEADKNGLLDEHYEPSEGYAVGCDECYESFMEWHRAKMN